MYKGDWYASLLVSNFLILQPDSDVFQLTRRALNIYLTLSGGATLDSLSEAINLPTLLTGGQQTVTQDLTIYYFVVSQKVLYIYLDYSSSFCLDDIGQGREQLDRKDRDSSFP